MFNGIMDMLGLGGEQQQQEEQQQQQQEAQPSSSSSSSSSSAPASAPAPASSAGRSQEVAVTGSLEFNKYEAGSTHATHALVHLDAPKFVAEDGSEEDRDALDIVAVVDVSGSMAGSKLELAKTTLEFIVENLTEKDRLSIIAYDSNVTVPLELSKLTQKNKDKAMAQISKMCAGSCTNLHGGLFKGIDIVQARRAASKAPVTSILLMTDGEANEGLVGDELIAATREKIGENPDFSLYTFGYGASHNEYLLKNLSEVGAGMYYFIENNDIIPESFGDCLGGLLSVVAQNMNVTVSAQNGATITKIHTKRRTTLSADGKTGTIALNDVQSEEKRDIVLSVTLPAMDASDASADDADDAAGVEYFTVKLAYVNALTKQFANVSTGISALRPAEVADADRVKDEAVAAQVNRIETTAVMEQAMEHARLGDLVSARSALSAQMQCLSAAHDEVSLELQRDMQQISDGFASRSSYEREGKFRIASKMQAHSYQRNNCFSETPAEMSSYTTSSRGVFHAKAAKKKMSKRG